MNHGQTGLRVAAATAACIAALGFAACGGDDEESGDSTEATEEAGATGATGASGTDPVAALEQTFRDEFASQGFSEEQVDCAIESLNEEISAEEFAEAAEANEASGGETPQEFLDAASAAIAKCK